MPALDTADLATLLDSVRTIAVVGASADPRTTSPGITGYLVRAGFEVYPVNPNHDAVQGRPCVASVEDIPYAVALDLVCIFRQPRFTAEMVRTVLQRIETTGEMPVVWTQIGVHSAEAERLAADAGLPYVRNRCIMVEHARG